MPQKGPSSRTTAVKKDRRGFIQLAVAAVIAISLAPAAPVTRAAPAALDCRNVALTAPLPGATIAGAVEIYGRALIPDFRFYKVEYSPLAREQWVLIGTDVIRKPVESGRLVVWQTTIVPDGAYRLRLHVVDPTGNYCEVFLSPLYVANARATPSETPPEMPTPTETPILTVVSPDATPTIRVFVPTEVTPRRGTPGMLPTRPPPVDLPGLDLTLSVFFFLCGACGMLVVIAFIGIVMLLRSWKT